MKDKKIQVILLVGPENSGKSQTITILHSKYFSAKEAPYKCKEGSLKKWKYNNGTPDFSICYERSGHTICIYSKGDGKNEIKEAINIAKNNKCDILIMPIRIGLQSIILETIESYQEENNVIKKIGKTEGDFDKVNKEDADEIHKKLEKIISPESPK